MFPPHLAKPMRRHLPDPFIQDCKNVQRCSPGTSVGICPRGQSGRMPVFGGQGAGRSPVRKAAMWRGWAQSQAAGTHADVVFLDGPVLSP